MSGLEKIKSQILDEANHSAEAKIQEAKARAEEMIKAAQAEADAEALRISRKSKETVQTYAERVTSSCDMQRKKAVLQAKQEVIGHVLDKAYESVLNLEDAAYFDMIRRMLDKYVQSGDGTICFSEKDLKRMPEGFEAEIQKTAGSKGGTLTLAREPKEMSGGFVLVYGGIEENCTVKAMFDARRDDLSDHVRRLMFS